MCFSVLLALRLSRLGKETANLGAFRTFVRFALVWFSLPFGVLEGLRLLIVALSGIFSSFFFFFFFFFSGGGGGGGGAGRGGAGIANRQILSNFDRFICLPNVRSFVSRQYLG